MFVPVDLLGHCGALLPSKVLIIEFITGAITSQSILTIESAGTIFVWRTGF